MRTSFSERHSRDTRSAVKATLLQYKVAITRTEIKVARDHAREKGSQCVDNLANWG